MTDHATRAREIAVWQEAEKDYSRKHNASTRTWHETIISHIAAALDLAAQEERERCANVALSFAGELTREMCDGCGNYDDVATGASNDTAREIAKAITAGPLPLPREATCQK